MKKIKYPCVSFSFLILRLGPGRDEIAVEIDCPQVHDQEEDEEDRVEPVAFGYST